MYECVVKNFGNKTYLIIERINFLHHIYNINIYCVLSRVHYMKQIFYEHILISIWHDIVYLLAMYCGVTWLISTAPALSVSVMYCYRPLNKRFQVDAVFKQNAVSDHRIRKITQPCLGKVSHHNDCHTQYVIPPSPVRHTICGRSLTGH